ncbi:MAG: hypothetical protein BGO12_13115 [Verrucomicrobia bacterium 61-8]|nr:MAG: hypothetical protein BGO12_13115 [Verrucomicrobia bacterium 61-8]
MYAMQGFHIDSSDARRAYPPVRLALIGVGGMGAYHLNFIRELEEQGLVKLAAVADPLLAARSAREDFESRGVHCHSDYRDMLDRNELDAVQIAAPISLHFAMVKDCLARRLFVNLEKPPVPLIQQLNELIRLDRTIRVSVGFQHICSPQIHALKRWILAGKLGVLREIRIAGSWPRTSDYYARPWSGRMAFAGEPVYDGPATNAMAHLIHNVMFLAGDQSESFARPWDIQAELYRVRPIESYDLVCLRGSFVSGMSFTASLSHVTEKAVPFCVEVSGSEDWVRIGNDGKTVESSSGIHEFPDAPDLNAFSAYHRQFIEFAAGVRSRPPSTLQDCLGFIMATNGALVSSGGIHDIPSEFTRIYGMGGDMGYDVPGLTDLLEGSLREGRLFSELGAPWAVSTGRVRLAELRTLDLEALMNADRALTEEVVADQIGGRA